MQNKEYNGLLNQLGAALPPDQEVRLPAIQLSHYPVGDTALAACLGTLGIPFREPAPFTDDVEIDALGNEVSRRVCFWMGDAAAHEDETQRHKTEELFGAWLLREKFEKEHPLHPLVAMRAAIDARNFWVQALQSFNSGRALLPIEAHRLAYATTSIHGASVLQACGYAALAFTGKLFLLEMAHGGVHAEQLLSTAATIEGATPPQWMARVLKNYSHLLNIAKSQSPILRQRDGDSTLLLTADATSKTRDQFHRIF